MINFHSVVIDSEREDYSPGGEDEAIFDHLEVNAILDTLVAKNGERMYKVAWKTTWESERNLKQNSFAIDRFWKLRRDKMQKEGRPLICSGIETAKKANLKRRSVWNLEDIVHRLKKSREEMNPWHNKIQKENVLKEDAPEHRLCKVVEKQLCCNAKETQSSNADIKSEERTDLSTQLEEQDVFTSSKNDLNNRWRYSNQLNSLLLPDRNSSKEKFQSSILDDKISETKCEKCNKRFYRKSQLIRHLANHVVHECTHCSSLFYCVRKYKRHLATHESWPCEFCDEMFYEASAWYKHRASHTMVECNSCDVVFYNKNALYKHKVEHMAFVCPSCRCNYSDINKWSNHRVCEGKPCGSCIYTPIIACKVCHETYVSQDSFLTHECNFFRGSAYKICRTTLSKKDISELIGVDRTKK